MLIKGQQLDFNQVNAFPLAFLTLTDITTRDCDVSFTLSTLANESGLLWSLTRDYYPLLSKINPIKKLYQSVQVQLVFKHVPLFQGTGKRNNKICNELLNLDKVLNVFYLRLITGHEDKHYFVIDFQKQGVNDRFEDSHYITFEFDDCYFNVI